MIKSKYKIKIIKLLKQKLEINSHNLGLNIGSLEMTPKAQKIYKMGIIKTFYALKDTIKKREILL